MRSGIETGSIPDGIKNLGQQAQVNSKYAGKRLLIADDDTDMRLLLAEYFRRLGFQVDERESGQAALEAALAGKFDCFIFDVSMPGMSGFDLLKRVRDRGIQTPALFLTALDALSDKVAGFEAGADDYLAKPFSPRELEYRVEALLRRGGVAVVEESDGDLVHDHDRRSEDLHRSVVAGVRDHRQAGVGERWTLRVRLSGKQPLPRGEMRVELS